MGDPVLTREAGTRQPREPVPRTAAIGVMFSFTALLGALAASALAISPWRMLDISAPSPALRERAAASRFVALAHEDEEAALAEWSRLSPAARYMAGAEHDALAERWVAGQIERLDHELDLGDCDAVNERLSRIARLAPEAGVPRRMAKCPRAGGLGATVECGHR